MTFESEERPFGKRDRLARMLRVVAVLRGHPEGIRPAEIARRTGVATRTVYRDLRALETEVGVAVWSEDGLWGVVGEEFLPPLKLTLDEAMAVVLSARLMVRYADKYDPDLAAAFEKLEGVLPQPLADHVERTLDVLAQHPRDAGFSERVHRLTRAWAERRVVTLDYEPARYAPESAARSAVVRPYLIEPSLQTHALYLIGWDETRDALRTFKIERIRDVALTPRTFELPEGDGVESALRRAWDIIADQPPTDVVLRFSPGARSDVASNAAGRPGRGRIAHLAGHCRGDDRDPSLDPVMGRRCRSARPAGPPKRRCPDAPACGRAVCRGGQGLAKWGRVGRDTHVTPHT
jgi:predicted DNA-binding transcriptional regulator YafY